MIFYALYNAICSAVQAGPANAVRTGVRRKVDAMKNKCMCNQLPSTGQNLHHSHPFIADFLFGFNGFIKGCHM